MNLLGKDTTELVDESLWSFRPGEWIRSELQETTNVFLGLVNVICQLKADCKGPRYMITIRLSLVHSHCR